MPAPYAPPPAARPALRLWTPEATTEGDTRTANPGVTPDPAMSGLVSPPPREPRERRWALRSVFTLLLWRPKRDELAASSWYDYRTLLARWEQFWTQREGRRSRGPDVRQISDADLRAFFEAQETWRTARTWGKYRDLFAAILRTCLVRSESNRGGPRAEEALLQELPWLEIPPDRWFKERARRLATPSRRGGHTPSRDGLLTVEEFDRVVAASQMATFPCWDGCDALGFWRAFWACQWVYGPRLRNLLTLPRTSINWASETWLFEETKKGNEVHVPLHPAVLAALRGIDRGSRAWLFPIPPGQLKNLQRNFYPTYKRIWQWAGVPLRMPHQLRATAISIWKEHAPEWRKFALGHSRSGDVQDQHYVIPGEAFRQAVRSFPVPRSLLVG